MKKLLFSKRYISLILIIEIISCILFGCAIDNGEEEEKASGIVISEAVTSNKDVLCGRGGGNAELVLDGTTGLIVPPADVAAVVEGLEYLRARPEERARMGAAGRLRIATEFSVENMVRSTLATYAEAMALTGRHLKRDAATSDVVVKP